MEPGCVWAFMNGSFHRNKISLFGRRSILFNTFLTFQTSKSFSTNELEHKIWEGLEFDFISMHCAVLALILLRLCGLSALHTRLSYITSFNKSDHVSKWFIIVWSPNQTRCKLQVREPRRRLIGFRHSTKSQFPGIWFVRNYGSEISFVEI